MDIEKENLKTALDDAKHDAEQMRIRITEQDAREIATCFMDFIIHASEQTIDGDKIPSDFIKSDECRALLNKLNAKGESNGQ